MVVHQLILEQQTLEMVRVPLNLQQMEIMEDLELLLFVCQTQIIQAQQQEVQQ
jgi:hypothetical protein